MKSTQNMRKLIRNKLGSQEGASLLVALLFFAVCAAAGSAVLAAATASMGRAADADTDANIQRYSLESAAQTIAAALKDHGDGKAPDFQARQSWQFQQVSADYGTAGDTGSLNTADAQVVYTGTVPASDTGAAIYSGSDYLTPTESYITAGDYVLKAGQVAASGGYRVPYPQLDVEWGSSGGGSALNNTWNDTWTSGGAGQTSGSGDRAARGSAGAASTLADLRNTLAEGIYRYYWEMINNEDDDDSEDTDDSGSTGETGGMGKAGETGDSGHTGETEDSDSDGGDPWNMAALRDITASEWQSLIADADSYTVSTNRDAPLTIDASEVSGSIYPVYADLSMDQTFTMTIHLYCGSRSGKDTTKSIKGKCDAYTPQLWLIVRPDLGTSDDEDASGASDTSTALGTSDDEDASGAEPVVRYEQTGGAAETRNLPDLYTLVGKDLTVRAASLDEAKAVVSQLYQGSNDIAQFKDAQEPAGGDAEYTYDLYQLTKSDAKVTRTTYRRTVTFSMNWEDAEITSVDPGSKDASNTKGGSDSADGQ